MEKIAIRFFDDVIAGRIGLIAFSRGVGRGVLAASIAPAWRLFGSF
ncbi:hypothetical protein [Bosea sp. F3-2]|nr:hypothetical protein [Bosea sp. F3-2]